VKNRTVRDPRGVAVMTRPIPIGSDPSVMHSRLRRWIDRANERLLRHDIDGSPDHVAALQDLLRAEGYDAPAFPGVEYDWWDEDVRGRRDGFWTFDPLEYREEYDRADVVARIRDSERLAGDSADVVLLHDHTETTDDVAASVRALRDAGVRFAVPV